MLTFPAFLLLPGLFEAVNNILPARGEISKTFQEERKRIMTHAEFFALLLFKSTLRSTQLVLIS